MVQIQFAVADECLSKFILVTNTESEFLKLNMETYRQLDFQWESNSFKEIGFDFTRVKSHVMFNKFNHYIWEFHIQTEIIQIFFYISAN